MNRLSDDEVYRYEGQEGRDIYQVADLCGGARELQRPEPDDEGDYPEGLDRSARRAEMGATQAFRC